MLKAGASRSEVLTFGPFRLLPAQRLLLEGNSRVEIGSRALDILAALVERAGELVTKDELLGYAWPNTTVSEANLRVNIAALRKSLGEDQTGIRYIASVAGRGYRFVAPVGRSETSSPTPASSLAAAGIGLPIPLTRMFGRDGVVIALLARLQQSRLVTIVGSGGIGKTTVAVATAERVGSSYRDGIRFVDLAPLADPRLVPSLVASAVGLVILSKDPASDLVTFLQDKHMLIVLDNCEHVIEAAAFLAERILKATLSVDILATSREPLGADGEVKQRLAPLDIPSAANRRTASEALTFSSIQLFVERAAASLHGFEMGDADAPVVADICARLDGLPLAIELAASRVDTFGIQGLAALLDDRFRLLMRGNRTALPRHRTLSATLDWSYNTLTGSERAVLRRLAVFAARFSLESATAVAAGAEVTAAEVIDQLAGLVAKSLVVADIGGASLRYRLLSTTRAYAVRKLAEYGELEHFTRRHAEHCLNVAEHAEAERKRRSAREWLLAYGDHIDDLRLALTWAFSPTGDAALGVALTTASVPLWIDLSLNEECRVWTKAALSTFGQDNVQASTGDRLGLFAALGGASLYTQGSVPELTSAWETVLEIAENTGEADYQQRSLWGLWSDKINRGENRSSLEFAERFGRSAADHGDEGASIIADRLIGYSHHILGNQELARFHTERMLSRYNAPADRSDIIRFQFDQRIMAHIALASILWLQGLPDQAMLVVEETIDEAQKIDHMLSLTYALVQAACPVALRTGDLAAAERFLSLLADRPWRHASQPWELWRRCHRAVLLLRQGDADSGVRMLQGALAEFPENTFHMRSTMFLGEMADGLGLIGEATAGLVAIDQAIAAAERCEERWNIAELLRIKGELLLKQGRDEALTDAGICFDQALGWARRQTALSWELRVAMSYARLRSREGRDREAHDLLNSVYGRFNEGFSTSDLIAAKALLEGLAKRSADR